MHMSIVLTRRRYLERVIHLKKVEIDAPSTRPLERPRDAITQEDNEQGRPNDFDVGIYPHGRPLCRVPEGAITQKRQRTLSCRNTTRSFLLEH